MTESNRLVGDRRCWPCTIANAIVAAFVAGVPLLAALLSGESVLVVVAVVWTITVFGYTVYRLVNYPALLVALGDSLRAGLPDSTTRLADTETVSTAVAVSTGIASE